MAGQPIKIMIVDDHAMVRKGMKAYLQEFEDICVIGEAADGGKAVQLVEQLQPDVVLMDLLMPGTNGIEFFGNSFIADPFGRIIAEAGTETEILVATCDPRLIEDTRRNSAIASTAMQRMSAVRIKEQFATELSKREIEVLQLLTIGNTDKDIARKLGASENTIRTHVGRIKIKLGVHSRVQAALYGLRSGLVSLDEISDLDEIL